MKVLITENQFKMLVENIIKEKFDVHEYLRNKNKVEDWFVKLLDQLKETTNEKFPDDIFWIHKGTGKVYIAYGKINKEITADSKVWSYFYKNYSKNKEEIGKLMKELVGEHLNIWDINSVFVYKK